MEGKKKAPPSKERLGVVPTPLAEALREATRDRNPEQLYELIDGVAEHDAEVAAYLRALVEDFAYDALADLFDATGS